MKLISVRAPWWWFIVHGGKDVENRSWRYMPDYRGPLAIHASKTWIQKEIAEDWLSALAAYRHERPPGAKPSPAPPKTWAEMESFGGKIVGVVDLVDAVWDDYRSPWFVGPLGLILKNPRPLLAPIPFKAALGLVDVPDEIQAQLKVAA